MRSNARLARLSCVTPEAGRTDVLPVSMHARHCVTADQDKKVRLLEVSKAKSSPFGLLSALAVGGVTNMARGEPSSLQSLATILLAGQLQKAAFQNGVTSNGATMAVMPDIQVRLSVFAP